MKKLKIGVMDIIMLLAGLCFLVGIRFVFTPCGPKEDGSFMMCHHAGTAITGIAVVLVVLAVLHLLMPSAKTKLGLALASLPIAGLAYFIPGKLHPICMMPDMRCHTVMTPGVTVSVIVLAVVYVIDIFVQFKRGE